jgi:hypothetical protein
MRLRLWLRVERALRVGALALVKAKRGRVAFRFGSETVLVPFWFRDSTKRLTSGTQLYRQHRA